MQAIVGAGASSLNGSTANARTFLNGSTANATAANAANLSAIGTYTYGYQVDGEPNGVGIDAWSQATTITPPQAASSNPNTDTVYTNYAGEPMLSQFADNTDPVNTELQGKVWNTFEAFDPQGRLVMTAEPSTQLDSVRLLQRSAQQAVEREYDSDLMPDGQGLIEGIDYYGPSRLDGRRVTGYVEGHVHSKTARSGYEGDPGVLSVRYVVRRGHEHPPGVVRHGFRQRHLRSDLGCGGARTTQYVYSCSGLYISSMTEILPVLAADQNGLGGTGTIVTDYNSHGSVADVIDADGYETSYSYDPLSGAVTGTVTVGAVWRPARRSRPVPCPILLGRTVKTQDGNQTASGIATNATNIAYSDSLMQSTVTTTPELGPTHEVVSDFGQGTVTTEETRPNARPSPWRRWKGRLCPATTGTCGQGRSGHAARGSNGGRLESVA